MLKNNSFKILTRKTKTCSYFITIRFAFSIVHLVLLVAYHLPLLPTPLTLVLRHFSALAI